MRVEIPRQRVWGKIKARQGKMGSNTKWWVTPLATASEWAKNEQKLILDHCILLGHAGWLWKGSREENIHYNIPLDARKNRNLFTPRMYSLNI